MFFSGVITSNHSVYKALSVTFAKQSIPSSIPCNRCKALCHCWLSPTHVIPVVQQTASRRSSSRRIMRSEQMWWTDMLKAYEKHYEELWSCWTFLCFVLLPQCLLSSKFFEVLRRSIQIVLSFSTMVSSSASACAHGRKRRTPLQLTTSQALYALDILFSKNIFLEYHIVIHSDHLFWILRSLWSLHITSRQVFMQTKVITVAQACTTS